MLKLKEASEKEAKAALIAAEKARQEVLKARNAKEAQSLPDNTYNESHWNTLSSIKEEPYKYSKTLAEKEAWKIYESQNHWKLFTINPGFVLGPPLSNRTDSESIRFGCDIVKGKFKAGIPDFTFNNPKS